MSSSALANFFLEKSNKENIKITNLKLQKLMFIAYGWILALLGKDLTQGESFQAWQHGPVLPSIYHEMKRYGGMPLTDYATDYDTDTNQIFHPSIQDDQVLNILNKVWDIYKKFSAWSLRDLTHEKDSPWHNAYIKDSLYQQIDQEITKNYYKNYIKNLLKDDR